MKKFEDEIKEMLEEEQVPEMNPEKKSHLKALVRKNRRPTRLAILRPVLASLCCVLVFIGILIPVINHFKNKEDLNNNVYYTDNTATRIELDEEFVTTYISNNFSKYDVMFEKCEFTSSYGYYIPDSNKLLAINITLKEISFPKTTVLVFLVVDNQFVYEKKNDYLSKAEIIKSNYYTLYKKSESSFMNEYMSGYFDYNDYDLYLNLNMVNNELFDLFL